VLLTVNEARASDSGPAMVQALSDTDAAEATSDDPGVDIGALQSLVSDCGGHLWLTAEPPGDMTLKIHLPRRVLDEAEAVPVEKTGGRPRWFSRLAGSRH
jgi:hypothetical protein